MAKLKKESERGRGGTNGFLIHDHIHKKPNGVCNIMCQNNPFKIPPRFIETIKHSLQKNPHGWTKTESHFINFHFFHISSP